MQSTTRLLSTAVAIAMCATSFSACRKKAATPPEPQASPAAAQAPRATVPAASDPSDAARRAAERERAERERLDREARERRHAVLVETIHFEFDRSDLSVVARASLDAKADALRADKTLDIRIEGHTDDRGSDEYNLALGMRRANAARRYLVQHGIDADRIEVVTLGEERRVCQEAEEACWRRNRRAEFVITGP